MSRVDLNLCAGCTSLQALKGKGKVRAGGVLQHIHLWGAAAAFRVANMESEMAASLCGWKNSLLMIYCFVCVLFVVKCADVCVCVLSLIHI